MWIFCGGMIRSGSTLQFQITARLVESAGFGKRLEWVEPEKFPELRDKYTDFEGWKVFKSHTCTKEMKAEFANNNARGVYVYRDLRAVAVSSMRKNSIAFWHIWLYKVLENCVEDYNIWTSLPDVMISSYENMVIDLPGEVAKIAAFLNIPISQERRKKIAFDFSIDQQKKRIKKHVEKQDHLKVHGKSAFDKNTLLHDNHIHDGEIDNWKKILSASQIALIENRYRDWLKKKKYVLSNPRINLIKRFLIKLQS